MVTVIVIINTLIALMLLFAAWQVWQLRQRLAGLTDTLIAVECSIREALYIAPSAISRSQMNVHKLRQGNEPLRLKLQRVQQILSLLGLGHKTWRRVGFNNTMKSRSILAWRSKREVRESQLGAEVSPSWRSQRSGIREQG